MRNSELHQRNRFRPASVLGNESGAVRAQHGLVDSQLTLARREVTEVYRELYEAAQMQRSLSGPRLLRRGLFEMTAEIFPVNHLSGDFFSISETGSTVLLAIGDICGKGLLAGMWFTYMLGLVRAYGKSEADPGSALHALNSHLCADVSTPPLTSMFLASLDYERGELLYSNAGHPAPILLSSKGSAQLLGKGGPLLGAVSNAKFETGRVLLSPGDSLVEFTDGLIECRNELGEEFGVDRLLNESKKVIGLPAPEMLFSLVGVAQDFSGTRVREDDCTLMVVRCKELATA